MKKRYVLIPLICVLALVIIIISVAIALKTSYLEKLSYDHMSNNVYNNVEVVGDGGLFYLVKDGKKVSDGYVSLISVNDFYSPNIEALYRQGKQPVIYDFYIAREEENPNYLLINSEGDTYTVLGDNYTLSEVKLPYLIFVNNTNGREAAVSLNRLDSDISYKSGSELTLRPFKKATPMGTYGNSVMYTYLLTEDISDTPRSTYFRSDGIKIVSGEELSELKLYKTVDGTAVPTVFFHDVEGGKLYSLSGNLVASDIVHVSYPSEEWGYAICKGAESDGYRAVAFTSDKTLTLLSDSYVIAETNAETLSVSYKLKAFGNCLIVEHTDGSGFEVINVETSAKSLYSALTLQAGVVTAEALDGGYSYLDKNGAAVMTGIYGDMTVNEALSTAYCTVLESASYNLEAGAEYLHFARAGSTPYSLRKELDSIAPLSCTTESETEKLAPQACYVIEKDGKQAVLAPFSVVKLSESYNKLYSYMHNGITWLLAADYEGQKYDIIDPLTAKSVAIFACQAEDFAKYLFMHDGNTALSTDRYDTSATVPMTVIKLTKYDNDALISSTKYFVLYRPAAASSPLFNSSALVCTEIGKNLLVSSEDKPYEAFTAENYLVTYSAAGSELFSLDDSRLLTLTASVPYHVTDIITDTANSSVKYFLVRTDNGMYGLYNTDSQAVLAPYYSKISSAEDGYFIVSQKNACGVIRLKNKEVKTVIDFSYDEIYPLGDHGYLAASLEGDIDVYYDNDVILSPAVQDFSTVNCFDTSEDGRLTVRQCALISAGGDLYIHRSNTEIAPAINNYQCAVISVPNSPLNKRAAAVSYYYGESVLHRDIIYPDTLASYEAPSSPSDLGWYAEKAESKQLEPLTSVRAYIEALDSYFIRLYAKAGSVTDTE